MDDTCFSKPYPLLVCLIVSLLIHLGLGLTLANALQWPKPSRSIVAPAPRLTLEFLSVRRAKIRQSIPPQDSGVAGNRSQVRSRSPSTLKDVKRQSPAVLSTTKVDDNLVSPTPTPFNLSKLLSDMREVAREAGQLNREQTFNHRKLPVDPENLKQPKPLPKPSIESYSLANGYQRTCEIKVDGKKRCMSKEPDDGSIWNAKIYLPESDDESKTAAEFSKHLQEAIGKY